MSMFVHEAASLVEAISALVMAAAAAWTVWDQIKKNLARICRTFGFREQGSTGRN